MRKKCCENSNKPLLQRRTNSDRWLVGHWRTMKERQMMLEKWSSRHIAMPRSSPVEPMPGLIKDLFAWETCGRRGHGNTCWRFADRGVVVPRHQSRVWPEDRSTWAFTQAWLGREGLAISPP